MSHAGWRDELTRVAWIGNSMGDDPVKVEWANKETGQLMIIADSGMSCTVEFKTMTRWWNWPGGTERSSITIDDHVWVKHNDTGRSERLISSKHDETIISMYHEWLSFLILAAECDSE